MFSHTFSRLFSLAKMKTSTPNSTGRLVRSDKCVPPQAQFDCVVGKCGPKNKVPNQFGACDDCKKALTTSAPAAYACKIGKCTPTKTVAIQGDSCAPCKKVALPVAKKGTTVSKGQQQGSGSAASSGQQGANENPRLGSKRSAPAPKEASPKTHKQEDDKKKKTGSSNFTDGQLLAVSRAFQMPKILKLQGPALQELAETASKGLTLGIMRGLVDIYKPISFTREPVDKDTNKVDFAKAVIRRIRIEWLFREGGDAESGDTSEAESDGSHSSSSAAEPEEEGGPATRDEARKQKERKGAPDRTGRTKCAKGSRSTGWWRAAKKAGRLWYFLLGAMTGAFFITAFFGTDADCKPFFPRVACLGDCLWATYYTSGPGARWSGWARTEAVSIATQAATEVTKAVVAPNAAAGSTLGAVLISAMATRLTR